MDQERPLEGFFFGGETCTKCASSARLESLDVGLKALMGRARRDQKKGIDRKCGGGDRTHPTRAYTMARYCSEIVLRGEQGKALIESDDPQLTVRSGCRFVRIKPCFNYQREGALCRMKKEEVNKCILREGRRKFSKSLEFTRKKITNKKFPGRLHHLK